VRRLVERGYDVTSIDINGPPELAKNYTFAQCDLLDYSGVKSALHGFDVVYHLAGCVLEPVRKDPYMGSATNVDITRNVIEACRVNKIEKVLFASSFYVYDGISDRMIVNEETPLNTLDMELFAATKAFGESLLKEYHRKYGLNYVILRYGSAYGLGNCTNVVKTFLEAVWNKQPIEVWGQGKRRNQYTYVDDLAEGSVLAIDRVNEVYNLISPEETSIRELAELLQKKYGFEVVFNTQRVEGASMPYMSSRKAIKELGWKPISLEEGIERMVKERFRSIDRGCEGVGC
jgi:nucleoside-diphosphate-sugar epimerase